MHSSRKSEDSSHARLANGAGDLLRNVAAFAVMVAVPLIAASAAAQYTGPHNQLLYNQVQYNDSAATQSPRIAQPQTLTPVRTYAPAPYPTTGAAIIQPEYLTPAKEVAHWRDGRCEAACCRSLAGRADHSDSADYTRSVGCAAQAEPSAATGCGEATRSQETIRTFWLLAVGARSE